MTALATPRHRVSAATAQMRAAADTVVDAPVWSMSPTDTASTLVELTRLEAQVLELKARVAAHADEIHVGEDAGASSAANWLAHTTRQTRTTAHGTVKLGRDLETHPATRDALAAGDLHADQARVILTAIDHLPDDLDATTVTDAERHLIDQAAYYDAKTLRILGKRLLEVVAPDTADAYEAKALEREEAAAEKAYRLTMTDDGHGQTHGRYTLPTHVAAALRKALLATMTTHHDTGHRTGPEAMGRAFGELITRYPVDRLPKSGGLNATIVVMIDEDSLLGRIEKAGILDTGEKISPALARRMACEAGIIPAVLGANSQILDLGRKRRLFTEAQRIALMLTQGGCTAEGCDKPPGMTHAHHDHPWSKSGPTDLSNARLLCPWHHARAHDPTYEMRHLPTGKVAFHRRT